MAQVISMLDFMYFGEVNIRQENLTEFLDFAADLEVKGVSIPDDKADNDRIKDQYAPLSNSSSQLLESHSMSSNLLLSSGKL